MSIKENILKMYIPPYNILYDTKTRTQYLLTHENLSQWTEGTR